MKQCLSRLVPSFLKQNETVIPVVRLHGTIASGGGAMRQNLSLASIAGLLEKAFAAKGPAVALSINSPGGSPVQSRLIYQRIRDLAVEKKKNVHVFVEDVAASGGYMIAVAGDEIVIDPSSIVGSIGVVSAGFGFTGLLSKIGVDRRVHTAGTNKSVLDPFQPEKPEDIEHLKALQLQIHQVFIDMVKARRGSKLADDGTLFTGLFWVGEKAVELGLVDGLGDMRSHLKKKYGEKTKLRLITAPRGLVARLPFMSRLSNGATRTEQIAASAASGLFDAIEERTFWSRYGL